MTEYVWVGRSKYGTVVCARVTKSSAYFLIMAPYASKIPDDASICFNIAECT